MPEEQPESNQQAIARLLAEDPDQQVRSFVALTKRRKALEDQLSDIETRLEALQQPLQDHFAKTGTQNKRVDGLTVYLEEKLWAKPLKGADREDAKRALEEAGLGDFVVEDFRVQSVSAYARELRDDNDDDPEAMLRLHPQLKGVWNVSNTYKIKAVQ